MNPKQLVLLLGTCVVVITIGVVMVSVFGIGFSAFFLALAILCPLSHLLMMRSMSHEKNHSKSTTNRSEEKSNVQNCH
ncbi:MAG TPA: DUF2933 domain-containing protein [Anaerolineales bacterium]|jgi:uncharacterized membrane protein YgaE (UPF0421/DUF939 family)|nr:DUF2933 domain-containing protein [Anaerolineales bacterium]